MHHAHLSAISSYQARQPYYQLLCSNVNVYRMECTKQEIGNCRLFLKQTVLIWLTSHKHVCHDKSGSSCL